MSSNAPDEPKVNSADEACRLVACPIIEKRTQDKILLGGVTHLGRFELGHRMIKTERGLRYYMLFKREPFHTFGQQFEGMKGWGESINVEALENAINAGCVNMLFVYPNGHMYAITKEEMKQYMDAFNTVRETRETHETTISCPMSIEKRWR